MADIGEDEVERVAEAIHDARQIALVERYRIPFAAASETKRRECEHFARAAIAALTPASDRIAELEAAVVRLTMALEMERGRGQPRGEAAEHDKRKLCLCPLATIARVELGGTCGRGGCPYGGDF